LEVLRVPATQDELQRQTHHKTQHMPRVKNAPLYRKIQVISLQVLPESRRAFFEAVLATRFL